VKLGRLAIVWEQWHYFNEKFFGGKLVPPKSIRLTSARNYDGVFVTKSSSGVFHPHLPYDCKIMLSTHQSQRAMTGTLLHEMVHQYQYQVLRMDVDHGPIFQSYCRWIERQTRFQLRVSAR
jgi:hypothetical protein